MQLHTRWKHFVYVLMFVPFISPFLRGHFCVRGRSEPESSSDVVGQSAGKKQRQGKGMNGKPPDCKRKPRLASCFVLIDTRSFSFTFLRCWETLSSVNKNISCTIVLSVCRMSRGRDLWAAYKSLPHYFHAHKRWRTFWHEIYLPDRQPFCSSCTFGKEVFLKTWLAYF